MGIFDRNWNHRNEPAAMLTTTPTVSIKFCALYLPYLALLTYLLASCVSRFSFLVFFRWLYPCNNSVEHATILCARTVSTAPQPQPILMVYFFSRFFLLQTANGFTLFYFFFRLYPRYVNSPWNVFFFGLSFGATNMLDKEQTKLFFPINFEHGASRDYNTIAYNKFILIQSSTISSNNNNRKKTAAKNFFCARTHHFEPNETKYFLLFFCILLLCARFIRTLTWLTYFLACNL